MRNARKTFDLLLKLAYVLEIAINRGEAHEGDLIEITQCAHHQFTKLLGWNFALTAAPERMLDATDRCFYLVDRNGPFLKRALQTCAELLIVEGFTRAVILDDPRHEKFGGLEGGPAFTAAQTFATAPHLLAAADQA